MPSPANLAKAGIAGLFAAVALATPGVVEHEGWRLNTYADPVGIRTACAGVTGKAIDRQAYSQGECEGMTAKALLDHAIAIRSCLPESLPDETRAAFVSFAYNVGSAKFCGSTLSRLAKAGLTKDACNELPKWVYAGGKVYPGLVKRRAAEKKLCLQGLE